MVMIAPLSSLAGDNLDKPIMIIRFNKDEINFNKPLQKVVKKALTINPNITFNLVSFVASNNKKQEAIDNLRLVTASLIKFGLSSAQIKVLYRHKDTISSNEIYIYAS